jgi:hypothetical protein
LYRYAAAAKAVADTEADRVAQEQAVAREEEEELASKEKELREADEAREELRRAQADAAKSKAAAMKEVSEAKAAKKDWEVGLALPGGVTDSFIRGPHRLSSTVVFYCKGCSLPGVRLLT